MKTNIYYTDRFKRDIKKLYKKNRKIRKDIDELVHTLCLNPGHGTPLGNGCFKIRLKDSSKAKGKSSGYRIITYYLEKKSRLTLLTIYSKSEKSNISDREIKTILDELPGEQSK